MLKVQKIRSKLIFHVVRKLDVERDDKLMIFYSA